MARARARRIKADRSLGGASEALLRPELGEMSETGRDEANEALLRHSPENEALPRHSPANRALPRRGPGRGSGEALASASPPHRRTAALPSEALASGVLLRPAGPPGRGKPD